MARIINRYLINNTNILTYNVNTTIVRNVLMDLDVKTTNRPHT